MNESEYQALVEASWRRSLSVQEQAQMDAWFVTRPDAQAAWEADSGLNQLLGQLPDAPVASNFTAQVLQAIDRDAVLAKPVTLMDRIRQSFLRPAPQIAWALALVGVLWFGYHQHQTNMRSEMAQGLSVIANVATLSDPAVLRDFESIRRLSASEDEELFAVLTK